MKKILIIDAQVFHTPAWHRGMGKYSTELISALDTINQQEKTWDVIQILLSSNLELEDEVKPLIRRKIKSPSFVHIDLRRDEITNAQNVMTHNRKVVDEHIIEVMDVHQDAEIDFLILSPMQGGICSVFPTVDGVRKSLIFYDIIPFMFHEIYFRNKIAQMESLTKLTELLKADAYLTISQTVANDLAIYLGVDPSRIHNIDGGPIVHAQGKKPYKVRKPFILMPTGNELRKNNRVGIQGFSEFNALHSNEYTLVVTSTFDPDQQAELLRISENVVFTGNISGDELDYLFEECEALLFPSLYEGLGLPVLEAMEKNKPVVCSDIMVFREISSTAFHFFNPYLGTSIAAALENILHATIDTKEYATVLKKYSWANTANLTREALQRTKLTTSGERIPVTIFAPNPEMRSDTGRTVQRLHSELSRQFNPTYYLAGEPDELSPRPNMFPYVSESADITGDGPTEVKEIRDRIYFIDDVADSSKILFTALSEPGVIVLSSTNLENIWSAMLADGLITEKRHAIEKKFSEQYAVEGVSFLASVVARHSRIVVFTAADRKRVEKLADVLKRDIQIVEARYPVSSLVYTDLLPRQDSSLAVFNIDAESHTMAVFNEAEAPELSKRYITTDRNPSISSGFAVEVIKAPNDRSFEDAISRQRALLTDTRVDSIAAHEAGRYGVTSVSVKQVAPESLLRPSDFVVEGVADLNILLSDTNKPGKSIQEKVASDYSYREFVLQIGKLLEEPAGN